MAIIKDGKFSIPLYHGTTGAFVDSIKEHGLGGVDHLEKIGAKSLMQDLFDLAERQGWTDENRLKHRKLRECKKICVSGILSMYLKGHKNASIRPAYRPVIS